MFVTSEKSDQLSLFDSAGCSFKGKTLRQYEAADEWHNLFRRTITLSIDERIFKPLYCANNGCPNAPIRVLIAMMVLKESQGLSDAKLFEECRYNAITRSALGLMRWDDPVPVESTYYLFRRLIHTYALEGKGDLMELMFTDLSTKHCLDFEVSGKRIRMDSKLLGSNIAWLSRYEIVHQTIRIFCKSIGSFSELDQTLQVQLAAILEIDGAKIVYKYSSDEVKTKLQGLGELIQKLLSLFGESSSAFYSTLKRVFNEQFEIDAQSKEVTSRPNKDISASSVQSPHDTDATYRNKAGNQVKGNVCNVTETCNDTGLNLIVNVDTRTVTTSDVAFLEKGIRQANVVAKGNVEVVHTDGAYNSPENQTFCKDNNIELTLHAIQGKPSRYRLETNESGDLSVRVKETGEVLEVTKIISKDGSIKWRIKNAGKYRYFNQKDIEGQKLRDKIANTPIEELQKRNNVEATMFQLAYHYPNAKSRYRGLVKHQMWANIRCVWVNFVRIANYVAKRALLHFSCLGNRWETVKNRLKRRCLPVLSVIFGSQSSYAGKSRVMGM